MDTPHRRILRVVRQSEESTTCELPVSDGACGSCRGCSFLSASSDLVVSAGRIGQSDKIPAETPVKSSAKSPTKSPITIELPSSSFAVSRASAAGRAEAVRIGDSVTIEAPGSMLLALSSVFYLAPAILMLFFAVSCSFLYPDSEALVALAAACGLGLGLGAILFFGPALRLLVTKQLIVRSDI